MRLGELCAGYGGLGMAVEEVFGATTAWFSEYDAAPSKILSHHWPDVPNYGDMTKIDWANIEHVDIISGGTPCQDLSAAGRRAGMTEGTRSNLWVQMREAIATQRPRYVVWENVRGAYSATAASDLEQCPGCMGDTGNGGTVLRALGRVLGDLSDLGYDAEWRGLRAADVGACHSRYRVFVLAYDTRGIGGREALEHDGSSAAAHNRAGVPDQSDRHPLRPGPVGEAAANRDHIGSDRRRERSKQDWRGQPAHSRGAAAEPASIGGRQGRAEHARVEGRPDAIERGSSTDWGQYAPAIRRWEAVRGTAPSPVELTPKGTYRLSARFAEWMMGLPDGWVTDPAIGISRNDMLKACGNGVVPQQAMAALRDMLAAFETKEIAA